MALHWKKRQGVDNILQKLMDADYADEIVLFTNTTAQAESLLHYLELAVEHISLYMNTNRTDCMHFNRERPIFTLNGDPLKLIDKFMYLRSSVSSTESDVTIHLEKAWTAIGRLLIIWKSDLSDKIKHDFFQVVVVSILLDECM